MRGLGSGHVTCGPMRGLEKKCKKKIYIYDKVVELVGGGSVINGAYPV